MKKLFLTDMFILMLVFVLLLMPWNINLARSGCSEFLQRPVCKNSLITPQKPMAEKSVREIVPGVFPFDDLIIKI